MQNSEIELLKSKGLMHSDFVLLSYYLFGDGWSNAGEQGSKSMAQIWWEVTAEWFFMQATP